ncbi:hypothetical protein [Halogeometricum limi]|uniref:GH26 domain-containing protein n=1 Tax=Halogeometricum limi TaxID=555875 RepID=A0A1I6IJU9_9EURY|nr:hypothetical protein [Halogeometricum limi]SFR66968.1 hypothetical protein SAMN04488124_3306 [Halogeometricum limi]
MKHGILTIRKNQLEAIEQWLGHEVDLVTTTYNQGQWGASGITWDDSNKLSVLEQLFGSNTSRQLVVAYEMAGADRGNYEAVARGDHDDKHRRLARELVSMGMGDTIFRLNHEFNLEWGHKSAWDNPDAYRDAFARTVREMQSVSGANFTFCFAPARNRLGVAPEAWPVPSKYWPDGEPAPIVTPSLYDAHGTYPDDLSTVSDSELADLRKKAWGNIKSLIQMWENFAAERGAGFGTAEWGVANDAYPNPGGGDNPSYIRNLIEYGESKGWEFQAYWNAASASGGGHRVYPPKADGLPNASAEFQNIVGQRLSGGTSDGGSTGDGSTTDPAQYGDYNTPQEGTVDWHIPLNENFADIEADIKDLAARIAELEQSN